MVAVANVVEIADAAPARGLPIGLAGAMQRLDARLRAAVGAATAAYGSEAVDDPHRGLFIGDGEVARLLARVPGVPLLGPKPGEPPLAAGEDDAAPLAQVARAFALEPLDLDIVLVALAPEIDLRYERLYAYLQDDVTRRRPSVDLILNLLCADAAGKLAARARFAADAALRRHGLLELGVPPNRSGAPLLGHECNLDEHVVRVLLDGRGLDPRLERIAQLELEPDGEPWDPSIAGRATAVSALARTARSTGRPLRLSFEGRPGSGRTRAARALAGDLGMPLLAADLGRAVADTAEAGTRLRLLVREARLHDAVLLLADVDALTTTERAAELDLLLREVESHPAIVVFAGSRPFTPARTSTRRRPQSLVSVVFELPDAATRRAYWTEGLTRAGIAAPADTIEALGNRFRLTPGQIADAVTATGERVAQRCAQHAADAAQPTTDELFSAARSQSAGELAALARKVPPRRRFDEIVLPADRLEQLHDICNAVHRRAVVYDDWGFGERLSLGKGLTVLFSGPSGTGKTLAAEILAGELGLELYKIDLSSVVSKFIGETEKNLGRIFDAAEATSAILFFDEADALFGKRSEVKDAHDRYANIETAYLLQKVEEYDGTVVLATNLARNMDNAFVRRIHFTLEFPLPDAADRLRIWRGIWPAGTPLHPDLDLTALADQIELPGGHIRNIALGAAFLATDEGTITTEHVLHATRREYQKLGQVVAARAIER